MIINNLPMEIKNKLAHIKQFCICLLSYIAAYNCLQKPTLLKDENKPEWKIPAQLRVVVWFGLEKDRTAWTESHTEAKLQVVAETVC